MEEQNSKTINAFDSLFTTNRIQMLKILLPRLAPEQQERQGVLQLQQLDIYLENISSVLLPFIIKQPPGKYKGKRV